MAARPSALVLLLTACVTEPTEGTREQTLVGGTQTTTTEFSTVVGLQHGAGDWFCTGVLVDKDWVLATASCFDGNDATQARLDDTDINDGGGRTIDIAQIHIHPSFDINSTTWNHDVAALRLAQSVTDRTPTPLRRDATSPGTQVTQVGFGINNNNGNGGGVLRSLSTTSVDCAAAQDSGITNANVMCFNAGDGTGSCYGDGGAPAFVGTPRAVAGLASGGTSSSCTSGLDIYTAIAAELAFIDTLVPNTPPPPTEPPIDPTEPPTDPDDTGPGRGDPEDPIDDDGPPVARGCSAGGGDGLPFVAALAVLLLGRRRRRDRCCYARSP